MLSILEALQADRTKSKFRLLLPSFFILLQDPMMTSIYPTSSHTSQKVKGVTPSSQQQTNGIRFPEDIQVIIRSDKPHSGNLYLSNIEAATNPQILQNLQIKAVLTAAKGHTLKHPKSIVQHTKYVPLGDDQQCDIFDFLDESVTFMAGHLGKTNVLVHCVAGVSRSAGLVIAFLMRERRLSLEDAFSQAKSRRRTIDPSPNIIGQLGRYEAWLSKQPSAQRDQQTSVQKGRDNRSSVGRSFVNGSQCSRGKESVSRSFLKEKSFGEEFKQNTLNASHFDDFEEGQSRRSHRSGRNPSINIEILAPKESGKSVRNVMNVGNPEEEVSFISGYSKKSRQSSMANQSFSSSLGHSEVNRNHLDSQVDSQSQSTMGKLSQSRKAFSKKMVRVDSLNEKVNRKYNQLQDKFQTSTKEQKVSLQSQLSQISKAKRKLHEQYSSKKTEDVRSVHQSAMESPRVQDYIIKRLAV